MQKTYIQETGRIKHAVICCGSTLVELYRSNVYNTIFLNISQNISAI